MSDSAPGPYDPQNADTSAAPLVPTYPPPAFSQPVASIPTPRSGTRKALVLTGTIVGLLLLVILGTDITVYSLARKASTTPPTVASILARASGVTWRDTTFSVQEHQTASIGNADATGTSITTNSTGKGAIIHSPFRAHLILNGLNNASTTEIIIDGDTYYLKLPPELLSNGEKPWLKITGLGGSSPGSSLLTGDDLVHLLTYSDSVLTQPRLVGSETIDGHATWHIHGTLVSTLDGTIPAITSSSAEDIWFAQDSALPVKLVTTTHESITTPGSGAGSDETVTAVLTNTYRFLTWNTGITIALPPANQVSTSLPDPTGVPTPTP